METSKEFIRANGKGKEVELRNSDTVCNPAYLGRITMHPPKIEFDFDSEDKYAGCQGSINFSYLKNILIKNGWHVKNITNHHYTAQILFSRDTDSLHVFILKHEKESYPARGIFTEADCEDGWVCGCEDSYGNIIDFVNLEFVVYRASTKTQKEFFRGLTQNIQGDEDE